MSYLLRVLSDGCDNFKKTWAKQDNNLAKLDSGLSESPTVMGIETNNKNKTW